MVTEAKQLVSIEEIGIDNWPVMTGVEYDEDGPALLCNSWTEGYKGHLSPCRQAVHGSTLAEIRDDLAAHIRYTHHYQSPFANLIKGN